MSTKDIRQLVTTPTHAIVSDGTAEASNVGYRPLGDFKANLGLGTSLTQTANNGNGTATNPAFTFTGDDNTGIIRAAADELGFVTNGSEKVRITSAGNVLIGKTTATANGGDLQVSSGITFPATQVPKSDANTLDDYEEGNWTPGWIRNDGGLTFTAGTNNWGRYTKIGRVVHIMCRLQGTLSGTLTGSQRLTGLPFVIREGTDFFNSGALAFNSDLRVNTSIDWALLRDSSFLQVTLNPFTGGTANVYINFTYLTDT